MVLAGSHGVMTFSRGKFQHSTKENVLRLCWPSGGWEEPHGLSHGGGQERAMENGQAGAALLAAACDLHGIFRLPVYVKWKVIYFA